MRLSNHRRKDHRPRLLHITFLLRSAGLSALAICLLLLGSAHRASAQATSATLSGVIRDSSGAVIESAEVMLTNTATGVVSESKTNTSGVYAFNNVSPGDYSLNVSKPGFAQATQNGIHLVVQQAVTHDFSLRPGSATENVTVEASTVELNTANASIGTVIEGSTVTDLPLNGRNFTQLLTLSPGVAPVNTGQSNGGGQSNPVGKFSAPSINGAEVRSNYYYLDGIDNTEMNYAVPAVSPIVDDIAEFKVQAHNDEAQFGGVTGAIINVVTKGGTNQYHGAVWEYLRNTIFNAANPFSRIPQQLVQNQYGANGGGPLLIPHLYNGRNKSFVFGSYEGFRNASPSGTATYLVPTDKQLTGDFSDSCPEGFDANGLCLNQLKQLYNPFTTTETAPGSGKFTRQPFKNNDISSLVIPQTVAYAKAYFPAAQAPQTTAGGILYNGINPAHRLTTQNLWSVRGDETFNPSNTAFFRYTSMDQPDTYPGSTTNYQLQKLVHAKQYVASYIHVFGPSSVFDASFGHNDLTNSEINRLSTGNSSDAIKAAGFADSLACNFTGGYSPCVMPAINIPNLAGGGEGQSTTLLSNVYQWRANYTKGFKTHSLSIGFNWENDSFHVINTSNSVGYQTQSVQDPSVNYSGPFYGGLAAYLMGVATSGGLRDTVAPLSGQRAGGFYLMDKWKISDKLTMNLGLRYDLQINGIYGSVKDGTIFVGDMDFSNGTFVLQKAPESCDTKKIAPCIPGGVLPDHVVVSKDGHVFRPNYNNWQPRLGLAYSVNQKTAVRAGFGIFYDMWGGITQSIQNIGGTWPTIGQITSPNTNGPNDVAVINWQNPIAGASQGSANLPAADPFSNIQFFRQPDAKTPYSEQWNAGIERELGHGTIVTVNYVGSQTHRLIVGGVYNTAKYPAAGTTAEVIARQPFPYITPTFYDRSIGNSSYNALQVSANHQTSKGIRYTLSYTWSKAINLGCDGFFGGEGCSIPNPYDLAPNRSVAGTDLPHVFSASFLAPSPFGKGQRFTTDNAFADYVLGNWSFNGITTLSSGQIYNVNETGDSANVNHQPSWDSYNRPDLVGDPKASDPNPSEWFNTSAFQQSAPYTFGNNPRNSLRGDGYVNFDASLFRNFPLGEQRGLQFRADAFNLFNHITYGNPNSTYTPGDPNFGKINGTRSTERQLQFALRLTY